MTDRDMTNPQIDMKRIYDAIIVGTGFSGLGLAIALKREDKADFIVLERADDVGGTWRDNVYPGAACDIPSHLYSYSFRPNPHWSSVYSKQPEIHAYLQGAARDERVTEHVAFNNDVQEARWNEAERLWEVTTQKGMWRGRALVSASGHLSDPALPEIAGIEGYKGALFHSARWDSSYDFAGQRIAVIGTGASAIQIVPELAKVAGSLTVFQRTAPYIVPRRDRPYTEAEKGMFARLPDLAQSYRNELFWSNEDRFLQRRREPGFISTVTRIAMNHLQAQVECPDLRRKLTPTYEIGCKRILISNDYFPAIQRDNVQLETGGIARFDEGGIHTRSGEYEEYDAVILATGFEATELPITNVIHGRDGRLLADDWRESPGAFACTTTNGYPNFFMMLGPNTGLGAGSMVYMVETQVEYIRQALGYLRDKQVMIEPTVEAERAFVADVHERSQGTVWVSGGCQSWYLHEGSGRLTAIWPDFMREFRRTSGTFREEGYLVEAL
jgi:cation diffusion facilitator CzcD-associated flavoprotein CzcO